MANRIVGNVIIVDSAMGNLNLIQSATGNFRKVNVNAIAFWYGTSAGTMTLSLANTALEQIIKFDWLNTGSAGDLVERMQWRNFGTPQSFEDLKVPVLTAGTGFIYLA